MDADQEITYQFDVSAELWTEWKQNLDIDRDQPLDDRIRELIRADRDGRIDL